jgi:hypothetical protein
MVARRASRGTESRGAHVARISARVGSLARDKAHLACKPEDGATATWAGRGADRCPGHRRSETPCRAADTPSTSFGVARSGHLSMGASRWPDYLAFTGFWNKDLRGRSNLDGSVLRGTDQGASDPSRLPRRRMSLQGRKHRPRSPRFAHRSSGAKQGGLRPTSLTRSHLAVRRAAHCLTGGRHTTEEQLKNNRIPTTEEQLKNNRIRRPARRPSDSAHTASPGRSAFLAHR